VVSEIILMSILLSMFVNRYMNTAKKIEASSRKEIIDLKSSAGYDKKYGPISMTSFPVNVFLLPFILPLVLMKSERLSDSILKF